MLLVLSGNALCDNSSIVGPSNGKDIIGCFSTFEVGSTSTLPTEQHNQDATTIGATGLAIFTHQWHIRKTIRPKTKERDRKYKRGTKIIHAKMIQGQALEIKSEVVKMAEPHIHSFKMAFSVQFFGRDAQNRSSWKWTASKAGSANQIAEPSPPQFQLPQFNLLKQLVFLLLQLFGSSAHSSTVATSFLANQYQEIDHVGINKIKKADEDVAIISAETPVVFAHILHP